MLTAVAGRVSGGRIGSVRGHSLRPRWRRGLISLVAGSAMAILMTSPVSASLAHANVVSATPAAFTPKVVLGTSGETVFAFAQVGTTMYVGGKFAQLRDSSGQTTYDRANFAAFNAKTGAMLPLTLPTNGRVEVIVPAPDGKAIYIGGTYTSIGGVTARGIVRYSLVTNTIDPDFQAGLDGSVTDAAFVGSRLIIGGTFTRHLRSIDPLTGVDTGYINLALTGKTNPDDAIRVRRFAADPAGTTLVALGNFTAVAGQAREQAFRVDLTTSPRATLSPWYAPRFDEPCNDSIPNFSRGVDFSPDGSYFVIVTSGGTRGTDGLCDGAARFETPDISPTAEPTWINWTGGDSLYSVAVTGVAVYVGGHQRWLDNPEGRNSAGPGAVSRPGIGAIDPEAGTALSWNPTKTRGHGTEKLYVTAAGLWVGSDGSTFAGLDRPGIAFCPVPK